MKRWRWVLCLLLLGGCTNYPLVTMRDHCHPGAFGPNKVQPYGGVCIPQGPVTGPGMPCLPGIGVPGPDGMVPPPPIGGGVIPPPAPLPPPGPIR